MLFQRRACLSLAVQAGVKWVCQADAGSVPYDAADTAKLEQAYQAKSDQPVVVASGKYKVDVKAMRQTNVQSGHNRDVKRVTGDAEAARPAVTAPTQAALTPRPPTVSQPPSAPQVSREGSCLRFSLLVDNLWHASFDLAVLIELRLRGSVLS